MTGQTKSTPGKYFLFGFPPTELFWSSEFAVPLVLASAMVAVLEIALARGIISGGPMGPVPSLIGSVFEASYVVCGAMLGVVLAAVAILVSFTDTRLLARMYEDNKELFERYFANIFFPIELAIVTVFVDILLRFALSGITWAPGSALALMPVVTLTLWQLTSLRSALLQIRRAMLSKAIVVAARERLSTRPAQGGPDEGSHGEPISSANGESRDG